MMIDERSLRETGKFKETRDGTIDDVLFYVRFDAYDRPLCYGPYWRLGQAKVAGTRVSNRHGCKVEILKFELTQVDSFIHKRAVEGEDEQ